MGGRLLLALVVLIPRAELAAQQQPWMPEGQYAVTFCRDGKAESWILASAAAGVHREALLAHEAVHRRQAERYTTCEEFYATITSPDRLIEVELPAYCAQLRIELRQGADSVSTAAEMALRLAVEVRQKHRARELQSRLLKDCQRQREWSLKESEPRTMP